MPSARPTSHKLKDESEGAILVAGIVMGTLLVSGLWNIVSVGDAIIWRERLQDAADAAAFENAVWNARGMNILAFLNIVMSAAMAILVVLNGIVILLTGVIAALTVATIACVLPIFPLTGALCVLAANGLNVIRPALTTAQRARDSAARSVPRFIDGLKRAQRVVAAVAPVIGVKEATVRNTSHYNMLAAGLSPSLTPSNVGPGERIGFGVSLPVEWGSESKLCEKAGRFVPHEIISLLVEVGVDSGLLNAAGGFIENMAGEIAGSLPSVFCGDRSPSELAAMNDMFRENAQGTCNAAREQGQLTDDTEVSAEQREFLEQFQDYWRDQGGTPTFDRSRCENDQFAAQTRDADNAPGRGSKPAQVWAPARNGNFFMQSWGLSYQQPRRLSGNDRGLAFAANGDTGLLVSADPEPLGTAQAEMYFDCEAAWGDCKGDAMWMLRWKARLRRLHNPAEMLADAAVAIAIDQVVGYVQSQISSVTGALESGATIWIGQNTTQGGFWSRAWGFMRGNLWSNVYPRLPWDPIGAVTGGVRDTVSSVLARDPPPASEVVIH